MVTASPQAIPDAPHESPVQRVLPKRIGIAIALVVAYWVARFVVNMFFSATFTQFMVLFYAPMLAGLGIFVWWVGLSGLSLWEKLGGIVGLVLSATLAFVLAHPSMPIGLLIFTFPMALTGAVAWIWMSRGRGTQVRQLGVLAVVALCFGFYTLLRIDGIDGHLATVINWRWTPTAEETLLAELPAVVTPEKETTEPTAALVATAADWPEFRGVQRDSAVHGVRISPDWKTQPPREVWRKRVGPGWSSFSVVGDYFFTQEQRGEVEVVSCYRLASGEPVWAHQDEARFWEVVAGAGPRATPTFHEGRIYSLGASGKLNCLDALTGKPFWTRDIVTDSGAKIPQWGFSSSPLIAHGLAIVFAGGPENKGVLAYDLASGDLKWASGQGTHSYSSAQVLASASGDQVLVTSDYGIEAFHPETGAVLWANDWKIEGMARVVQPHLLNEREVLVGTGYGFGLRRLKLSETDAKWNADEVWTSKELKPYFNDFVVYQDHAYGFDGSIFGCIDIATGDRTWKKGRYGHGQVLLLADQGLLIVISESGELALLEANSKKLVELGKFQALPGKTWNHPVVVGNKLLVRNDAEMACYELQVPAAE